MTQPKQFLKPAAVAAIALLALAACGSSADGESGAAADSKAAPAAPKNSVAAGALVTTRQVDGLGTILVGRDGKTLYTTEAEAAGSVKCVDSCTSFWPPLTTDQASVAESIPGITGKFGVVTRPDKTKQLTLDGLPLYNFAEDRAPGATRGDGFEDDFQGTHFLWLAAKADGAKASSTTSPTESSDSDESDDSDGGYDYGY